MSREDTWTPAPQYDPQAEYERDLYGYYDTRISGGSRNPKNAPRLEDYYSREAYERFLLRQAYKDFGR